MNLSARQIRRWASLILTGAVVVPTLAVDASFTTGPTGSGASACGQAALASRALQGVCPYARRLRSTLNRDASSASEERLDGELTVVSPALLRHAREVSLSALEYLKLFSDFGALPPPLVRDRTGTVPRSLTLGEALGVMRESPSAVVTFRWPRESNEDRIPELFRPPPEDRLPALRQRLWNIQVLWLVDAERDLQARLEGLVEPVVRFCEVLRRIHAEDPTFSLLVGKKGSPQTGGDEANAHFSEQIVRTLLEQATDVAVWEGDVVEAARLVEEARRFATERQCIGPMVEELDNWVSLLRTPEASAVLKGRRDAIWNGLNKVLVSGWQEVGLRGFELHVPDGSVDVPLGDGYQFVAFSEDIGEALQAPWLSILDVAVLGAYLQEVAPLTDTPVALTHLLTRVRKVRTLRVREDPTNDSHQYATAQFMDLEPGPYRIELLAPGDITDRQPDALRHANRSKSVARRIVGRLRLIPRGTRWLCSRRTRAAA